MSEIPSSHREPWRRAIVLELPSNVLLVDLVDQASEQVARIAGLDEPSIHDLCLAVREAVVNGIRHGNRGDEGKSLRVEYSMAPADSMTSDEALTQLIVRIRDEGRGFDPQAVKDPRLPENLAVTKGRGVFLMRSLMDTVDVVAVDGGTEVVMTKRIGR